jgi:uncharacterized protein RhaS with RHS repeats
MGERYYDPLTARWTQTDPLDQSGDLRQSNPYTYTAGDPINLTDPTGLFFEDVLNIYSAVEALAGASLTAYAGYVGVTGCAAAVTGIGLVACAPAAAIAVTTTATLAYYGGDKLIDYADLDYADGNE